MTELQTRTKYTYDSFGNIVATSGSLVNSFRYTGREFDPETSLYYYRARYYDPAPGRFLSEDPIGINGGINFYSYVANSAIGFVDSTGEHAQLDPHSRCAEVFAKAFKPDLCPEEYAKEFNDIASRIPIVSVPSDRSPTSKLTENDVSHNKNLSTLGSHFFGVDNPPTAITIVDGRPRVIVLGPGFGNQPPDLQHADLIHEELHGVTGLADAAIFDALRKYGLPITDFILDPTHPTGAISDWIRKGCPPKASGKQ